MNGICSICKKGGDWNNYECVCKERYACCGGFEQHNENCFGMVSIIK